ncbi:MAG: outer membrane lipoprotein-sorting protein [Candidatus Calescibacterium sp.]|nr:outer membrane lipoprotein-sorting protein [Candidatus Calescibacterium sp.]MDW8086641.1 outer membrane lipoprotein-sorting protein [Candidatus Calescibacterium sp.]
MKRVDSISVPKTSQSSVRMIIKKEGETRERKLVIYTKEEGNKRLSATKFLEPADVRGTAFLQISSDGNTQQFLYLSSLKKTRRIAGGQKKTSFMGSEITYEDLERKNPDDYEHKLLKEDEELYVVESVPKKGIESQYSKAISYIRKSDFFVIKTELFSSDGKVVKIIENVPGNVEKYLVPLKTKVRNIQNGNETEMIVDEMKVDIPVESKYFSESLLGTW